MAKKPAIRVALDLETTGLHAEQDAILEVAAIKFQDTHIVDTFETFVSPGRSIPYRVQRLTGITSEHLIGAPPFTAISAKLQHFLGDYPIVGHSIPFDAGFLRRWGLARTNSLIDTFELATVLLPSLSSYNLGQVAESLGISVPLDRHRAMVDTVLAMQVFLALYERLQSVDLSLLKDLATLDAPRSWPLLQFFRQELRERQDRDGIHGSLSRGILGDRFAAQLGMDPRILSFAIAKQDETTKLATQDVPLEVSSSTVEFAQSPHYQTARSIVRSAFEQHKPLLMEVATGGSNDVPALLPALEWITEPVNTDDATQRRLVIACAHQQHARRLTQTILPRLQAYLKTDLPVAYLAERGGYLCVHRWFGAALKRTSGELTAEQARGLAKVGLWAQQTLTGERSELTLLPQESSAWQRIASGTEQLPSVDAHGGSCYQRCTYQRKGYCFVRRAEERVDAARIIVTTHQGLLDDLAQPASHLSSIPYRLVLDADSFEEETDRWSSAEIDQTRLITLLNTIGSELPEGRYQGLLALAAPSLKSDGAGGLLTTPTTGKADLDARMLSWFKSVRLAREAVEKLFVSFSTLFDEYVQEGVASSGGRDRGKTDGNSRGHGGGRHNDRQDHPLRFTSQVKNLCAWHNVEENWSLAAQRLQAVIDSLYAAEKVLLTAERNKKRSANGSGEESAVAGELTAIAHELTEQKKMGQQAISLADEHSVYWLRIPPPPFGGHHTNQRQSDRNAQPVDTTPVLHSQFVQTPVLLHRLLLTENTSTIFAGSALSADNSFAFYQGRLGLENDACEPLSLNVDHHEQTLLYIPGDVPEPNAPQYQRHLDEALIDTATNLEGQLIALFTSHAALRSSYMTIKPLLEARGILVLGQGIDGSPRQLWQVFHKQEHVVLLGTGSFWDGFEEPVASPTCLFITRLPMPVLNDPPMAARSEQYSDQLHTMTVPMAALRIRRALNRLMWSDTKRNAIVMFDRRIVSKEYGSIVLHSLPRCSQRQTAISQLPETLLDWLTGTGALEA